MRQDNESPDDDRAAAFKNYQQDAASLAAVEQGLTKHSGDVSARK